MAYTLPPDSVPALGTALYVVTSVVLIVGTNAYYIPAGLYDARSRLYAPVRESAGSTDGAGASAQTGAPTARAPDRTRRDPARQGRINAPPAATRRPAPNGGSSGESVG